MITFLEYVNIRRHNKEWQFAADGYIPLSPSILKEFERDVKGVYHVTDIEGLQKLAKLEGKRVDISTFSKGSKGLSGGLLRTAEVLVTLDGKSSIDFAGDVASKVDRNGVRWLSSHGTISPEVNDIVFAFGRKILKKVVSNFKISEEVPGSSTRTVPLHIRVGNWIHDKDGKTKREFIKYYHTEAKKLINKQLINKINKAVSWYGSDKYELPFGHDEILLHNFKIVSSRIILGDGDKAEKTLKRAKEAGMGQFKKISAKEIEHL